MRFRFIDAERAGLAMPIFRLCRLLQVSVSGFYAWRNRGPSQRQLDDMVLLAHVRAAFRRSRESYGAERVHHELAENGIEVGRHRVARLMRGNGLSPKRKQKFKKTTDSQHNKAVASNLLDQNFSAEAPNEKWAADISYIWTAQGWLYLAVMLDLYSCPDLELVLPARKEAVETPFLEEMREAARLAVYRTMAQADPAPRVAWTDWHRAKEAGIELPEPPAELRPWRPGIADTDYWDERSAFAAVGSDALVMQADPEPPEAQALHRALGLAGLQGGSERTLKLFAPEPRFEGYPWYDTLARVTGIETLVTVNGAVHSLDYFTSGENGGEPERPETIVMHLNVLHPPKSPRHCFRKCDTIAIPADLAFAGEAWSSVHDALPLVTANSDIAPEELARLLRAAFFSPSDDAEADSWETQLTRFEEDALHMSLKLMCSVEEARQRTIADAVWREIFWLMPRDRTVTIVVRGGKVSVDIGPVCTEAATDADTGEAAQ